MKQTAVLHGIKHGLCCGIAKQKTRSLCPMQLWMDASGHAKMVVYAQTQKAGGKNGSKMHMCSVVMNWAELLFLEINATTTKAASSSSQSWKEDPTLLEIACLLATFLHAVLQDENQHPKNKQTNKKFHFFQSNLCENVSGRMGLQEISQACQKHSSAVVRFELLPWKILEP